jgi:hypothetical protein
MGKRIKIDDDASMMDQRTPAHAAAIGHAKKKRMASHRMAKTGLRTIVLGLEYDSIV